MLVEHQVSQLVTAVVATSLSRLVGVQEDERSSILPERKPINSPSALVRQGEDADAVRLEDMNDV